MSNRCADSTTCPQGDCIGCAKGLAFCDDPRCYPNCPGCPNTVSTTNSDWVIITIMLVLLGIVLVLSFIIGFDWFNARKKAKEPKKLVVNKHLHSVEPPPIMLTSPAPIVKSSPVSCQGVNL